MMGWITAAFFILMGLSVLASSILYSMPVGMICQSEVKRYMLVSLLMMALGVYLAATA